MLLGSLGPSILAVKGAIATSHRRGINKKGPRINRAGYGRSSKKTDF